jgi:hypothetical protein
LGSVILPCTYVKNGWDQTRMIIPDFYICIRKNGWDQSVWLSLISAYGQGRMAEPKHVWLSLISAYSYVEIKDNHTGLVSAILPYS